MNYDHPGYWKTRRELETALERLEFRKRGLSAQLQDVIHRLSLVEREYLRISNQVRAVNLTVSGEESIRLVQPPEAVFEAIRLCYSKYPWSVGLEDQDLGSLLFAMRLLPYRPVLQDVTAAMETLSLERGLDTEEELTWAEVKEVLGIPLLKIKGQATIKVSGRVVKVR